MKTELAVLAALALFATATKAFAKPSEPTSRQIVAAVLIGEAGGETNARASMRAVFEVIRNRAFELVQETPDVWQLAFIALKPEQFSCLNGTTPARLVERARRNKNWRLALRIVDRMPKTNLVKGANHYCRFDCAPEWVTRGVVPVARVGNHVFYKL